MERVRVLTYQCFSLSHTHTHTHKHVRVSISLFFCSLLYINLTYSCYKRMHGFICFLVLALVKGWWGHEFRVSVTIQFPFCLYCFSFSSLDQWPLRWLGLSCPGTHVILCSYQYNLSIYFVKKRNLSHSLFSTLGFLICYAYLLSFLHLNPYRHLLTII